MTCNFFYLRSRLCPRRQRSALSAVPNSWTSCSSWTAARTWFSRDLSYFIGYHQKFTKTKKKRSDKSCAEWYGTVAVVHVPLRNEWNDTYTLGCYRCCSPCCVRLLIYTTENRCGIGILSVVINFSRMDVLCVIRMILIWR